MKETIGFIGLGHMGLPIATNLQAGGFKLRVYNRTAGKAKSLVEQGAVLADAPQDAATRGGIILSIVSDDRVLDSVATDALADALGSGGLHISMSTVAPQTSQRLAERLSRAGASLLAAPVFGRPESAAARKLWICASGRASDKERAKPIFDAISQGVFDFGESVGAGNVVKLAGNFLLTAAIEAMAEASALAEKNGIPRAELLNMLTSTLFNCPIYTGYGKRVIDADYDKVGFSVPLILKDMHLVQQTAALSRAPMPMVNLLCDRYISLIARGKEKLDASAIALGAAEDAGLKWG
jgi:3-hydroxyisobutyrate dehydrogenase-like beta-hydroxyacid dehydrogenase